MSKYIGDLLLLYFEYMVNAYKHSATHRKRIVCQNKTKLSTCNWGVGLIYHFKVVQSKKSVFTQHLQFKYIYVIVKNINREVIWGI